MDLMSSMMTMEGVTMNMMMFDLDSTVSKVFYQPSESYSSLDPSSIPNWTAESDADFDLTAAAVGKLMTKASGIHHLVPGAIIDETSFSPCGYSMNAVLHDAYSTIHVKPEPECSYASFETNNTLRVYSPVVRNVLNVFGPKRFVLTMFADEVAYNNLKELPASLREVLVPKVGMYVRTNLSSTNIGTDLHCIMACFSLVSSESHVLRGVKPVESLPLSVHNEENIERATMDNEVYLESINRRPRGNTVDLPTENRVSTPVMPLEETMLIV
jgi:hypothetical protein